MKEQTRDLLLMLVIGAGIGIIGVYYWGNDATPADEKVVSTPSGATTTIESMAALPKEEVKHVELPVPPTIPSNTRVGLSVMDQVAGDKVTVTDLQVTGSEWVAIYDERGGRPSWILGAGRVREGDTATVVHLLRPMVSGNIYYAALLSDDGDDQFNRLTDLPPLSPDKVIVVRFGVK